MMYIQMAQEEQQKITGAVAHSVVEPKLLQPEYKIIKRSCNKFIHMPDAYAV
jgi:hypothetical protein